MINLKIKYIFSLKLRNQLVELYEYVCSKYKERCQYVMTGHLPHMSSTDHTFFFWLVKGPAADATDAPQP
jgi:hypothetical protein